MGEAKRKQVLMHECIQPGADRIPSGDQLNAPPLSNTGGTEGNGSEAGKQRDRNRINVTLPDGVYQALQLSAEQIGIPLAQLATATLMAGLPSVAAQLRACEDMVNRSGGW